MASLWGMNGSPNTSTDFWGINGSPSTLTDYSAQSKYVGKKAKTCNQQQTAEVKSGPSHVTTFGKEHLSSQFMNRQWNGLDTRQSTFTSQRVPAKRHYEMPCDGEPTMKRLLSERMAAGMRGLNISDDNRKLPTNHNASFNELWQDGQMFGAGINQAHETWKQDRLDKCDSDESGCEDDQPQLIIEQDFLDVLKSQNVQPSLPPQILTNIRESAMQLVLWKPVPFLGISDHKAKDEEDTATSAQTADSKRNRADDNMADSPVDEDMDL